MSFAQATFAFNDAFAVEWIDEREAYGEERCILLGMINGAGVDRRLHGAGRAHPDYLGAESNET